MVIVHLFLILIYACHLNLHYSVSLVKIDIILICIYLSQVSNLVSVLQMMFGVRVLFFLLMTDKFENKIIKFI